MLTLVSDYDLVLNIKTMAENINENRDYLSERQSTVGALPFSFATRTKSSRLIGPETDPPLTTGLSGGMRRGQTWTFTGLAPLMLGFILAPILVPN